MFVLVHSPLVGAFTWSRVAKEMRRREKEVLVARLRDKVDSAAPFWKQHAESVAEMLAETPAETRVILVAHSGAGPLLPAIRAHSPRPVAGYVFMDAGILWRDESRLDLLAAENAAMARAFETELKNGARFPTWSANDLREIIRDMETRETLARDLQPRGLDFFQEPLPAFDFPDARSGYVQFSAAYDSYARQAHARGWKFRKLDAGHFHMLVDPVAVTDILLELTREIQAEQTL